VIGGTRKLCNPPLTASLAVLLLSTKVLLVALSIGQSIRLGAVLFLGAL